MGKKDFCSPENFSVLIPYKDLENLLKVASSIDEMKATIRRLDERNAALQSMYAELLEKITEINRYL